MNISNIVSVTISVILSCITLMYYTKGVLTYRYTKAYSLFIIICGYIVLCLISYFQIPILNIVSFFAINIVVLYAGFSDSIGSVIMRVIILLLLMMFGELIMSFILRVTIESETYENLSGLENYIYSVSCKLIYFIEVVLLRNVSHTRSKIYRSKEIFWSLILPVSTFLYLILVNKIFLEADTKYRILFAIISIMLILSNFIVYFAWDKIIDKNIQIQALQNIERKKEIDYKSYELIKEKYDELRIVIHDIEKYCNNIEAMLSVDQREALAQIRYLKNKNKEFLLVEYTNNKALNVLLSQKMQECNKNEINFQIYIKNIDLSFLKEPDIISIFANLIDNAIESCKASSDKKMLLSIDTMNEVFVIIRMDNSSECEPTVINGRLQTHKMRKNIHGIGMLSIERALKNYNGNLKWEYDAKTHTFRTIMLINKNILNN